MKVERMLVYKIKYKDPHISLKGMQLLGEFETPFLKHDESWIYLPVSKFHYALICRRNRMHFIEMNGTRGTNISNALCDQDLHVSTFAFNPTFTKCVGNKHNSIFNIVAGE